MIQTKLNFLAPNTLQIVGALDFTASTALLQAGIDWLRQQPIEFIDMAGVTNSNSAGLALLLEWQREAKKIGRKLTFTNMPASLKAAASLYGVAEWLR